MPPPQRCFVSKVPGIEVKREVEEKRVAESSGVGARARGGRSGPLERRKRKTGVHCFAQQMLKRPQRLLRANGSLQTGK